MKPMFFGDSKRKLYGVVSRQILDTPTGVSDALIARAAADLTQTPGNITRKAILRILGSAAKTSSVAHNALLNQLPYELKQPKSGMYEVIAGYLGPDELREAIAHAH